MDEYVYDASFIKDTDEEIFDSIHKRIFELVEKFPEKKVLFEGYLKA